MTLFRSEHTARLLQNGKVLVAGGSGATAELYDPATGTWAPIGTMTTAHGDHNATLLADGRILVSGGIGTNFQALATAEIYSPTTGTWTATGSMTTARTSHSGVLLTDGTVLLWRHGRGPGQPGHGHLYRRGRLAGAPERAPLSDAARQTGRCWRLAASRRTPLGMPFRPPAPPSSRSVRR